MLISKTIYTKWNSKTKEYYVNLGYEFTKMSDEFLVNVSDLKDSSSERVEVQCDYCHTVIIPRWAEFIRGRKLSEKDTCGNCKHLKAKETIQDKYGVDNLMDSNEFKNRRDGTILEKYGVANVFQLDSIKKIIRKTMLSKYGKESFTQTDEYIDKKKATNLQRYGVENIFTLPKYREMLKGDKSPRWKGGDILGTGRREASTAEYKDWRNKVFARDHYLCQKCFKKKNYINAHHIKNWKDNPLSRYKVSNGITLCEDCHNSFHSIFGKKNNTRKQLTEFLSER